MKKEQAEKIALRVLDWCVKTYGASKYYTDGVAVETQYKSDTSKKTYGEFDRDDVVIYVFTRTNRTVKCLVNTVLHEYTHYRQPPQWVERYLKQYGGGKRNPYEQQAEIVANMDTRRCMKDLKLGEH